VWVAFLHSFTGQAIAAVALVHALLLPLLTGGWISAFAYGLAALGLSSAAVAVVVVVALASLLLPPPDNP